MDAIKTALASAVLQKKNYFFAQPVPSKYRTEAETTDVIIRINGHHD